MKFIIKINSATTVEEISEYWSSDDYIKLLEKFNYPDAEKGDKNSLEELLLMAITDYEPNEAAAIILDYKLADKLNEKQIDQISNNMLLDKISEEYSDMSLHCTLYPINQLLFKAFNGKFPNTKATLIDLSLEQIDGEEATELTKSNMLQLLDKGLAGSNLIKRLFEEQMRGIKPFPEAEFILWQLKATGNHNFKVLTSEYWLSKDDLMADEFEGLCENEKIAVEI